MKILREREVKNGIIQSYTVAARAAWFVSQKGQTDRTVCRVG
jgi:hypothetical protein